MLQKNVCEGELGYGQNISQDEKTAAAQKIVRLAAKRQTDDDGTFCCLVSETRIAQESKR